MFSPNHNTPIGVTINSKQTRQTIRIFQYILKNTKNNKLCILKKSESLFLNG